MAGKRRARKRRDKADEWVNRWCQRRDGAHGRVSVLGDDWETVIREHDTVPAALTKAGADAGEQWLWCLHCERFFQAKDLKRDFLGNWQQCPFDDCGAAGFDVDITFWEHGLHEPEWPRSVEELAYGLCTARRPRVGLTGA